ncbi:hypothetical protein GUJ93_ZPchr0012g20206 [Zizania palustris]|uniref:Uncharacterized protein n=1 Tax=Zizania palustris TaxID=103762 RepID=A0A8J5WK44_ZIZPA|nr:hypothetical protein GUJ93_ZPchr0012g20206 [Zizania palustris]
MASRLVLLLAVVSLSFLVASPTASARPCHTFFISFSANSNPNGGAEVPDHRAALTTATVITVFRVRRIGPHLAQGHGHGHAHAHPDLHHLHSIPANIQIHRPGLPEIPHPAAVLQERAKDILMVVVGILFGVGCGALTAASMYLVWSILAGAAASSHYEEIYSDEDDEASDSKSPKKAGYVIIPGVDAHDDVRLRDDCGQCRLNVSSCAVLHPSLAF